MELLGICTMSPRSTQGSNVGEEAAALMMLKCYKFSNFEFSFILSISILVT